MEIIKLNESNFETVVNDGKTFVVFYANWCVDSQEYLPIIEEYAKTSSTKIALLDVEEVESIAKKYNITALPTSIVFKNGEAENRKPDCISKEEIDELIANVK